MNMRKLIEKCPYIPGHPYKTVKLQIPPWPYFGDDETKAVEKVLRSGDVNQWTGSEVTNMKGSFGF